MGRNSVAATGALVHAPETLRTWQRKFGAQPADRRSPERQHAAIKAGKLDDN